MVCTYGCVQVHGKCVAAGSGTQASTLTCHTITSTCRSRKTRTPKVRNFLSDNRILRFATRLNSYRLVCGHMYRLNNRFEPGAVIIIGRPPDAMRRRRYRLFDRVRPMRTKAISVSSSFQILFGTVQHSCLESKHKENTSRYGSGISGGGGRLPSRACSCLKSTNSY